jgi:kynurenine formamidase
LDRDPAQPDERQKDWRLDLKPYVGMAMVVPFQGERMTSQDLIPMVESFLQSGEGYLPERLLFKTSWNAASGKSYPCFEMDALHYLYANGVGFVGIDTPSIDKPGQQTNRLAMRDIKVPWLVNIDLSRLEAGQFVMLFAAPFHSNLDAAVPSRAFVIPMGDSPMI